MTRRSGDGSKGTVTDFDRVAAPRRRVRPVRGIRDRTTSVRLFESSGNRASCEAHHDDHHVCCGQCCTFVVSRERLAYGGHRGHGQEQVLQGGWSSRFLECFLDL